MFWSGPPGDLTSYSQASAEDALVAAAKLPLASEWPTTQGIGVGHG
jgi:hypothetical protein